MNNTPHSNFVFDIADIDARDTSRFGGKATGLARMASAGIPIPPAFVISTDAYKAYRDRNSEVLSELMSDVSRALIRLEAATGKNFNGSGLPLLVSVRSGAKISMPGMMDTVLNLGLSASTAYSLANTIGNAAFAVDTWMRFWKMFAEIVLHADVDDLLADTEAAKARAELDGTLEAFEALEREVVSVLKTQGIEASTDPRIQIEQAIVAVFESWESRRAKSYRDHHGIPHELGTAVTVQSMVFGNMDSQSGSGVAFTRNPNTGANKLYGEYLTGCQGEDLVSGVTTPVDLADPKGLPPALLKQLTVYGHTLEKLYRDAVDIEFTVESSRLYLLQVRPAKRTAQAAVQIAVDMASDKFLAPKDALKLVTVEQIKRLLRPTFDNDAVEKAKDLAVGVGSSPGHASGKAVLDSDRAADLAAAGEPVILLRPTTSPQDIRGMLAGQGIITAAGGALSHAAVVSRALDKPCVVGCETISVDLDARTFTINGVTYDEGTTLSVDGTTGKIYLGAIPFQAVGSSQGALGKLLSLADAETNSKFWIAPHSDAEAREVARQNPNGLGVIALTDLLISSGSIENLIDAINELSRGDKGKAIQDRLAHIAYVACHKLILENRATRIDIRLPNVSSPRAQKLINSWAGLAPKLFLPLGEPLLYQSLAQGIADAAKDIGHSGVTVLVGGITDPLELEKFRNELSVHSNVDVGAVVQNMAALQTASQMLTANSILWLDLPEIVRTFHGYPDALLFADDVFDSYTADGYLATNPKVALTPSLYSAISQLLLMSHGREMKRLAVDFGASASPQLIGQLYDAGYRNFGVPAGQYAATRLMLAQRNRKEKSGEEKKRTNSNAPTQSVESNPVA